MLSIKYLGIKLFTMSGSIVCWWAMIIFVIVKLFNVHCCNVGPVCALPLASIVLSLSTISVSTAFG